jgi:PAS domain S-box-containing protein
MSTPPAQPAIEFAEDRRKITIAVIDDTEQNLYTVSRYLRRAGFEVWEGRTGAEALSLAARQPKLIILDVKLPDMIGYEVCRKIKTNQATSYIPVIHTSATYIESQDREEGLAGGADAYFTGPLKPNELIATVQALVRVHDAQERADAAADQWRASFDAISSGACLINGGGTIERCNSVLADLAGRPRTEIEGTAFSEFAATGVISPLPYIRMLETHQREMVETQARNRWWKITADPLFDDSGAWSGAICILTDISERKQTDAQLRRSERALSEFFENAPIGLQWLDDKGVILRANRAELEMLGYTSEEYVGRPLADFHPNPGEVEEILNQMRRGERVVDREVQLRCKNGLIKEVMISSSAFWEDGRLVHFDCFLRDITESKRIREELIQARQALEQQVSDMKQKDIR